MAYKEKHVHLWSQWFYDQVLHGAKGRSRSCLTCPAEQFEPLADRDHYGTCDHGREG